MPPISRPPPTRRTSAATSAAAQPASAPPSDEFPSDSYLPLAYRIFCPAVVFCVLVISNGLLIFTGLLGEAASAQLASILPGEEVSSLALARDLHHKSIALAFIGFLLLLLLYLCTSDILYSPVLPNLEDSIGRPIRLRPRLAVPRSLDPAVIETFPTVVYSTVKGNKIGEASLECAVCLNDFLDDDTLRLIPKCNHAFHLDCISAWLASHATCPVCRANLASQPAGDSASRLAESVTEPPQVEVTVEAAPPDGSVPERSPREGGREQIQPPDPWDKNESGSFNNHNQTSGSDRIRRFPRSHSTGHSLVRPGEDTEGFALRLPAEVRKQLMDRPEPVLPLEGCSRQGYWCGGEESSRERYFRRPDPTEWPSRRGGLSIGSHPEWLSTVAEDPLRVPFDRLDRPFVEKISYIAEKEGQFREVFSHRFS